MMSVAQIPVLVWILAGGVAMSAIALVGSVTLLLSEQTLRKVVLPLVAFAAGSLIGGAFFHMIPAAARTMGDVATVSLYVVLGFAVFFVLEQLLHYHHCHRATAECRQPLTYLVLIGDGLHNLLGGMAVAGTFLIDVRLGITTWLAAAAHEVPQELGDFGVLVHGGWPKQRALVFNVLSALTFLLGGVLAYVASFRFDVSTLVAFAAGNFLYIGASDLVPEVNRHRDPITNVVLFIFFAAGLALLFLIQHR
ncbi:MAG: ZIP family metal transporter [Thermodesulfobacteriota bacterium]